MTRYDSDHFIPKVFMHTCNDQLRNNTVLGDYKGDFFSSFNAHHRDTFDSSLPRWKFLSPSLICCNNKVVKN